jgi:uncharacterized protein
MNADFYIQALQMQAHPEGGYFKEMYRSAEIIPTEALPTRYKGGRCYGTSICFLLRSHEFSAFHRIQSDEIWHFYAGSAVTIYEIDVQGNLLTHLLGNQISNGETFQAVIKAGNWFAARVQAADSFALVGCTVAPGFDFADFELAKKEALLQRFPQHSKVIEELSLS